MKTLLMLPLLVFFAQAQTTPAPKAAAKTAPVKAAPSLAPPGIKEQADTYLDQGLQDKNPDTRKTAVQSLSLVGARQPYLGKLIATLDDKDVEVRLATIATLVDLKSKETLPALHKALNEDTVPEVEFAAAKALYTLNDPAGEDALIAVLGKEMKTSSGFVTKQMRDSVRLLHTPRPLMMFALKTGASAAPVPGLGAGFSSLQGILTDPGVSGRAATALLLATEKDPRVLAALQDALDDKDASVRSAAAHAIALRNDPSAEALLIPLLDDKRAPVRLRAAAGCLRLELIRSEERAKPKRAVKKAASK